MSGLGRNGTAEPVSRGQSLTRELGEGKNRFLVQLTLATIPVWSIFYSAESADYTYVLYTRNYICTPEKYGCSSRWLAHTQLYPTLQVKSRCWSYESVFVWCVRRYRLGVCGFYLKLFQNTLLCQCGSPSVRPIRAPAYYINTPRRCIKYNESHPW